MTTKKDTLTTKEKIEEILNKVRYLDHEKSNGGLVWIEEDDEGFQQALDQLYALIKAERQVRDDTAYAKGIIKGREQMRQEIGREFWDWFNKDQPECIEDAIERVTGKLNDK